jgi:hypothetical protein
MLSVSESSSAPTRKEKKRKKKKRLDAEFGLFRLPDWPIASCLCCQQQHQQKTGRPGVERAPIEYPTAHIERRPCVLLSANQLTNGNYPTRSIN